MKHIVRYVVFLLFAAQSHAEVEVKPSRGQEWKLVWSDEFDRDGAPNPDAWEFEEGFLRNQELQWYKKENAKCKEGSLLIEARRERVANPSFRDGNQSWRESRKFADYTSASLITKPTLSWKYGRFEVRARFSAKPGLWPAIWTTGHGSWPQAGEIDIMEFYDGKILANFVQADKEGKDNWNTSIHPITRFAEKDWDEKFHLWVTEWDENEIRIYLDGHLLNTHDLTRSFNGNNPKVNPFRAPHRLRLNLAVGANGGDPSKTPFPQRYEVDYVRVFQKS